MGLDTVELVMEFEDTFDLAIPDTDAEKMQRVGDTFDYVVARLAARAGLMKAGVCPTARNFYWLRSGLQDEFGVPRVAIRPDAKIGTLIPEGHARQHWSAFAQAHDLPKPPFSFFPTRRFPEPETTIGELLKQARGRSTKDFCRADGSLDEEKIWRTIVEIVSEQMGIKPQEIHAHSHYINDLGCD